MPPHEQFALFPEGDIGNTHPAPRAHCPPPAGDSAVAPTSPGEAPAGASDWLSQPEAAFRQWKASQRVRQKEFNAHSVDQYGAMFGAYVRWLGERGLELATASPEHLDLFLASKAGRAGRPAAATTRRRYLRLLNNVYEHLRLLELRKDNPAACLIDLSHHQDYEKPAPTLLPPALADRYVSWCLEAPGQHWVDARNRALRLLFLATGVTVKEAQRLAPDSVLVDQDEGFSLQVQAHGFTAARSVPAAVFAATPMMEWLAVLRRLSPAARHLFPARRYGFGHDQPIDEPVSATEAFLVVQDAMAAIGYDRHRQGPQTLRNTYIARQIRDQRPTDRIMAWAGLNSPDTVNRIAKLVPLREGEMRPG